MDNKIFYKNFISIILALSIVFLIYILTPTNNYIVYIK
jgi:hypothetical protein